MSESPGPPRRIYPVPVCGDTGHMVELGSPICTECGHNTEADDAAPGLTYRGTPPPSSSQWPCRRPPMVAGAPPRLLAALYLLLRDHVQPGAMEQVMLNVEGHHDARSVFCNPWLENLARSHMTYLLEIPPSEHTGQRVEGEECDDPNCPLCGVP